MQKMEQEQLIIFRQSKEQIQIDLSYCYRITPSSQQSLQGQQKLQQHIQKKKNPFQPKMISHPQHSYIKSLVIFTSAEPIKSIEITSQHLIEKKVKIIFTIHKFQQFHYGLAYFNHEAKEHYSCCINYLDDSITRHKIGEMKVFQGVGVIIISRGTIEVRDFKMIKNRAIFESINFVMQNIIQKSETIQKQLFPWFRQFYEIFEILSEQQNGKILDNIQINKKNGKITQYFLYFFYSIYKQQGWKLYQKYQLDNKMRFQFICRIVNKNYPDSQQLFNFYLQANLLFAIKNYVIFSMEQLKNLINFNIACQPSNRLINILIQVSDKLPKVLTDFDEDIKNLFINQKNLHLSDFFKIKVKYFPFLLEKKSSGQQVKYLMQFMKELNDIQNDRSQPCITGANKQSIQLLEFQVQKLVKNEEFDLPKFYSRCKILSKCSMNELNLVDFTTQIFIDRLGEWIKYGAIKTILSMLIIPINNFDRQQLSKVFNNKKIDTADWIQVIRQIITNDKNEFDLQYLQQKLIEVNDKIDITLILDALDKILFNIRQKKSKNILNRQLLINKLFMIFTSQIRIDNRLILKKYLDSCSKLREQLFKQIYLNKIFNSIKNSSLCEQLINLCEKLLIEYDKIFQQRCEYNINICRNIKKQ